MHYARCFYACYDGLFGAGNYSLTQSTIYVLVPFMSAAEAPAPTAEPDLPRAGADMPAAVGRVLGLVRKLIEYGKDLASALHRRATVPGFAGFARPFGEADVTVILARVTNGLRLAAALEARLCRRAARGQDLRPAAIPLPVPRATRQAAPA
jgi:hypothetical protein